MIELDNRTDADIDIDRLQTIADSLSEQDIELIFTDDNEMRAINLEFRQIDRSTDVLSFPYETMPMSPLGSIVISVDFAKEASNRFSHTLNDEIALLFIHGLLHLLGFDHESDNGEMRQKERELIVKFSLPSSLIVRTEEGN